ncbi:hypothetical protein LXL04_006873 [Taraxacum kok-saghyz]
MIALLLRLSPSPVTVVLVDRFAISFVFEFQLASVLIDFNGCNYPPPSATSGGESRMKNLTLLLLFFLLAAPSTAEIRSVKIRSDDRGQIIFDYFIFRHTGHITIAISSVSITSIPVTSSFSRPDPSRFGFYLQSEEAEIDEERRKNYTTCTLDSKFTPLYFPKSP